jgi:hypothetical protein
VWLDFRLKGPIRLESGCSGEAAQKAEAEQIPTGFLKSVALGTKPQQTGELCETSMSSMLLWSTRFIFLNAINRMFFITETHVFSMGSEFLIVIYEICTGTVLPPLWSSGQSSWLLIQRFWVRF